MHIASRVKLVVVISVYLWLTKYMASRAKWDCCCLVVTKNIMDLIGNSSENRVTPLVDCLHVGGL